MFFWVINLNAFIYLNNDDANFIVVRYFWGVEKHNFFFRFGIYVGVLELYTCGTLGVNILRKTDLWTMDEEREINLKFNS